MLKYLIVQTCDTATSFCHYENTKTKPQLITIDTLRETLLWSMKENLNVQFVLPDYQLPQEYEALMESIDHTKVCAAASHYAPRADVVVFNGWESFSSYLFRKEVAYAVRTDFASLQAHCGQVCATLPKVDRLNIVLTDVERMDDSKQAAYSKLLDGIAASINAEYKAGHAVQLNLLTDRLMLTAMNNCNAGWESVTLAPDGKFYLCPAFYFDEESEPIGSVAEGLDIKNPQLYRLDHAPICRICDAWHCRRCVWLNRRTTLEVNTPGREQCVTAHVERNAAARLLASLKKEIPSLNMPASDLTETTDLDPFDKIVK